MLHCKINVPESGLVTQRWWRQLFGIFHAVVVVVYRHFLATTQYTHTLWFCCSERAIGRGGGPTRPSRTGGRATATTSARSRCRSIKLAPQVVPAGLVNDVPVLPAAGFLLSAPRRDSYNKKALFSLSRLKTHPQLFYYNFTKDYFFK